MGQFVGLQMDVPFSPEPRWKGPCPRPNLGLESHIPTCPNRSPMRLPSADLNRAHSIAQ